MSAKLMVLGLCLLFPEWNITNPISQGAAGQRVQTVTSIQTPKEQPNQQVFSTLRSVEKDSVAKSAVPVLLPTSIRDFAERRITVEDMYYSAFFNDETHSVSVQGSRLAREYPALREELNSSKRSIRSSQGFITESEAIWTASWNEFGAAYVLSVECAESKDKRCESDDYIVKLTNSLVYVGGGKTAAENSPRMLAGESAAMTAFSYNPPGKLLPGSGTGRSDSTVYSPELRFPIENKPAFANSQVYNPGGNLGPAGGQCAPGNYSFPWWDNFCEKRDHGTPLCPTAKGHQGQDIRPRSCEKDKYFGVSATDGIVTHIGSYSVFITAPEGTQYRYLHMSNIAIKVGDKVRKGDHIGRISNVFTAPTTIHLHFEILQNVNGLGFVHVPPYMSLVKAYERLP